MLGYKQQEGKHMSTPVGKKSRSLTLELPDSAIAAETFRKAVDAFIDLINEVTKDVSGSAENVKWTVSVSRGSTRIRFQAESINLPAKQVAVLTGIIQDGFQTIQTESKRPVHFSTFALKKTKELVSVLDTENGGPHLIRIKRNRTICSLTPDTIANIDSALGRPSRDYGSIEGRLSSISERTGHKFTVYDSLLDKHISCTFPRRLLSKALNAFGKRISVSGIIRYSEGGEIENVHVKDFEIFPDSQSLPKFADVFGILGG
jgi:hypothetical protein